MKSQTFPTMIPQIPLLVVALLALFQANLPATPAGTAWVQDNPVKVSAYFETVGDSQHAILTVVAEVMDNWHLFSLTTPKGGPLHTRIQVPESDEYQVMGDFEPKEDPHLRFDDVFSLLVEEHKGTVEWSAPIKLAEGVAAEDLEINLKIRGQVCDDGDVCLLVNEKLTARNEGTVESTKTTESFEPKRAHVVWTGEVSPARVAPGDQVTIRLTAKPTGGYKIYGLSEVATDTIAQPTRIGLSKSNGWSLSKFQPSYEPESKTVAGEVQSFHKQPVTWSATLTVPKNADARTYQFRGMAAFQNCTDEMCDAPSAAEFRFSIEVGSAKDGDAAIQFEKSTSYGKASRIADRNYHDRQLRAKHGN